MHTCMGDAERKTISCDDIAQHVVRTNFMNEKCAQWICCDLRHGAQESGDAL